MAEKIVIDQTAIQATMKALFLKNFETEESVWEACKKTGIKSRTTIYNWKLKDKKFADDFEEVANKVEDHLSSSLILCGQGKKSMTQPQVTSAIFMLKALNPKKYQEKFQHNIGGLQDQPVEIKTIEVRLSGK